MQPFAIVEAFDVADDCDPRGIACREGLTMDKLVLQRGEEAFRACIVVAVAMTAHAGQQAIGGHQATVVT